MKKTAATAALVAATLCAGVVSAQSTEVLVHLRCVERECPTLKDVVNTASTDAGTTPLIVSPNAPLSDALKSKRWLAEVRIDAVAEASATVRIFDTRTGQESFRTLQRQDSDLVFQETLGLVLREALEALREPSRYEAPPPPKVPPPPIFIPDAPPRRTPKTVRVRLTSDVELGSAAPQQPFAWSPALGATLSTERWRLRGKARWTPMSTSNQDVGVETDSIGFRLTFGPTLTLTERASLSFQVGGGSESTLVRTAERRAAVDSEPAFWTHAPVLRGSADFNYDWPALGLSAALGADYDPYSDLEYVVRRGSETLAALSPYSLRPYISLGLSLP